MTGKELFKKYGGAVIWFGESEETAHTVGVIVGYNDNNAILAVTNGEGDYVLSMKDTIPNIADMDNEKGYLSHDLDGVDFDDY